MGVIPNKGHRIIILSKKRKIFWNIVNRWKTKNWEIAMHGYTHIYDTNTKKKIILIMVVAQNFLVIQLKIKLKKLKMV